MITDLFGSLPHVLTTAEVATLLDVSPETVRDWAVDGTLPARRTPGHQPPGGHYRFPLHAVVVLARRRGSIGMPTTTGDGGPPLGGSPSPLP